MLKQKKQTQTGSILFIILVAVALFGALSYAVSQMMREGSPETLAGEKANIMADEILDYTRALRQGMQMLEINGCGDSAVSFANPVISGYTHTPAASEECKIFNAAGAGLAYVTPAQGWLDATYSASALYGEWYFPAGLCIPEIGTSPAGTGCNSDSVDNEDLIVILPYIKRGVCTALNEKLGLGAAPLSETGNGWPGDNAKFTGTPGDGERLDQPGRMHGCFAGSGANTPPAGTYHFFQVLSGR